MPDVLNLVEKVANFIDKNQGGVTFRSDKVTYPPNAAVDSAFAPFKRQLSVILRHANAVTGDDDIGFSVQGNLGYLGSHGAIEIDKPVLANVFFDMTRNSAVFGTSVELQATAGSTAVGSADAPRVQFFITGRFSSLGAGSCRFSATLEIDNEGRIDTVDALVTEGDADIFISVVGFIVTL